MVRVSASQISRFTQCPYDWYWKYIEGISERPNSNYIWGKSLHEGLRYYYTNKKDVEKAYIPEFISGYYDESIKEIEHLLDDEERENVIENAGFLNTTGKETIELFLEKENYNPILTEEMFGVEAPFTIDVLGSQITGYIDLVNEDGTPIEWKSSRVSFGTKDAGKMERKEKLVSQYFWQTYIYPLAVQKVVGIRPKKMEYNIFLKRKRDASPVQNIIITHPLKYKEQAETAMKNIFHLMENKVIVPSKKDLTFCTWCGAQHKYIK
jgi:hypothetical protein